MKAFIKTLLQSETILYMVFSNVKKGVEKTYQKVEVKPIMLKEVLHYHFSYYYDKKVSHENLLPDMMAQTVEGLLGPYFKQGMIYTDQQDYQILYSKKGIQKVIKQKPSRQTEDLSLTHNRQKQYLILEGQPCDFMTYLGVMDEAGKVFKKKYDKFRQLNKYLEFVEDAVKHIETDQTIRIIDFGCGKAYLTFALYYYLVKTRGLKVDIIGLDLKEDVIHYCNDVVAALGYEGLRFEIGDIKDYQYEGNVDMVVSLHACDIATDEALGKAVNWGAKVIMAVPCCQHELFNQMQNTQMNSLLRHGVVKDKLATLVTDSLRTSALEIVGYETQMVEFIDMEHTPKNVLIRAYKRQKPSPEQEVQALREFEDLMTMFKVSPSIVRTLGIKLAEIRNITE